MDSTPKERLRVNTVEAKNRLNELITQAAETKRPIIVERRGEPVAVVLDYEEYQRSSATTKKARETTLWKELQALHRHLGKKYPRGTGDSVEILREMREERMTR